MFLIANYTLREILKSKILFSVIFLGIFLLLVCYIAYSFTYGVPERVALDFGLGIISLSSVAVALFMGVSLLSNEIESKTIYMILSRPISRSTFIIGRILGMMIFILINIGILSLMTFSLYILLGGEIQTLFFWSLFYSFLEASIVLVLVILFSLVTNNTLSVIFTLAIYILGYGISNIKDFNLVKNQIYFKNMLLIYQNIFPDFSKINIKDYVLFQPTLPLKILINSSLYGLSYVTFLILIAVFIFKRKNLD